MWFCVRVTRTISEYECCEPLQVRSFACNWRAIAEALCCQSERDWLRTAVGAVGMGKRGLGGPANGSWVHGNRFVQWGSGKGPPPNCIRRGGGKAVGCKCSYRPSAPIRRLATR